MAASNDAFTGFKNELPADEILPPHAVPDSPPATMLAPPSPDERVMRADSTSSSWVSGAYVQDGMNRFQLSPQTTGRSMSRGGHVGSGAARAEDVSEMQG